MTTAFGELLRRHRLRVRLSQEALAELAGMSSVAISAYERCVRSAPRFETVALLVSALQLSGEAQAEFEGAADQNRSPVHIDGIARNNLPWQGTSFIGRQREVEEISALLAKRQIVTITGTGGMGKTRTSLEVAGHIANPPRDGIWFVDLAPLNDGALAVSKIASTLELELPGGDEPLPALISAIKDRELLLILDNCEHVIATIRLIAASIVNACSHITIMATSREHLAIAGEIPYALSALAIPSAAVELFADRAAAAKHGFTIDGPGLSIATDICRRLDGIPLAIELAAARVPLLGLGVLREQLTSHFHVVAGRRDPIRHQTLHGTIAWSHDLLGERERTLFRRLAVFCNGWTIEAAQLVCADDELSAPSLLETLISLVEKSLVTVDLDAHTPRYSFLESTRAFALEELAAAGEAFVFPRKHAQWMAEFAKRLDQQTERTPRRVWEAAAMPEIDNALVALAWAFRENGDPVLGATILNGLRGVWLHAGLIAVGHRYMRMALERIDEREHPELIAVLLSVQVLSLRGSETIDTMQRAISLLSGSSNQLAHVHCYSRLAQTLTHAGRFSEAVEALDTAFEHLHAAELQRSPLDAGLLRQRASTMRAMGCLDEARDSLSESLSLSRDHADDWQVAICLMVLAEIEFSNGNAQQAAALVREALTDAPWVRGAQPELYSLCNLACYELSLGNLDAAETSAREALDHTRTTDPFILHVSIQHLAAVAALQGEVKRAARFLGFVDAWYKQVGAKREVTEQKSYDILVASLRAQISDQEIAAIAAQASNVSDEAIVADAMGS